MQACSALELMLLLIIMEKCADYAPSLEEWHCLSADIKGQATTPKST